MLHHATPRIFYGCELHPGAIDELLGFYPVTERESPPTSVIASLWRKRWLACRIKNTEILDRVAQSNAQTLQSFFTAAFRQAPKSEPIDDVGDVLSRAS